MARPRTSLGFINTDTQFAEDILLPGVRDHLETFYENASPEDKARCLELLTSLDIGQAARDPENFQLASAKRPKSAMGSKVQHHWPTRPQNFSQTTYSREYSAPAGIASAATRPSSTKGFHSSYDPSGPIGYSSYRNDYGNRDSAPYRVSLTMIPRNNPHPLETFMNWRLPPMKTSGNFYKSSITGMDEEVFDKVCRGQINSTYQNDYLGIPQGFVGIKNAFPVQEDWRSKVPYTLDTNNRFIYQRPKQEEILKGNVTRYGCSKIQRKPAESAVPSISKNCVQNYVKARTTYDREYSDPYFGPQEVRDLARPMVAKSIKGYVNRASQEDKRLLEKMLTAYDDKNTMQFK